MTLLHTVPDESSRNETAQNVAASIKRMVYPSTLVLARPISSMPAHTSSSHHIHAIVPTQGMVLAELHLQDRRLYAKHNISCIAPGDAMLTCILKTGGIEQRNTALLIGGCFAAAARQDIVHLF